MSDIEHYMLGLCSGLAVALAISTIVHLFA